MAYTDKQILDRLREHIVDKYGSVWTMSKPSWNGVTKRMLKDADFAEKVEDVVAEANYKWEQVGLKALFQGNTSFNFNLYKYMTQNKKAFLTYEVLDMEERLKRIEDAQAGIESKEARR